MCARFGSESNSGSISNENRAIALAGLATAIGILLAGTTAEARYPGFGRDVDTTSVSSGRNGHVPSIRALELQSSDGIRVDGILDDAVWQQATTGGGFRTWDPDRGALPSEDTVFKVAYDREALYVAVACLEEDPSRITQNLSRRDQFSNTDQVSIYLDPYHDKSTGYNFRVNPLGVQQDSYVFNDGETDPDWDAVWGAETSRDEHGWYAEMRIPFSSIRYREDSSTWGLQVYRFMHGRGEDTAWVTWDRDVAGFVSRFGTVTGLTDIPAPRQLEVTPYTVARMTDFSAEGDDELDEFQNLGLDFKYGVTADLTLNATLQPDFGQVEADPAQLNLTPYETFFQEKRPFFVEGNRFFEHPEFRLFYSRRIGTGDENSRIRYAAKLTGKTAGGISLAGLAAATDVTTSGQAHNFFKRGERSSQFVVGRVGKEFNDGNQRVNVMQTAVFNRADREDHGDRASREAYTSGFDFETLFADRSWALRGTAVGSVLDPEPLASDPELRAEKSYGTGGELSLQKQGGTLRGSTWGRWETGELDLNDVGFLSAPDEMGSGVWLGYRYAPDGESSLFNRGDFNFNHWRNWLYESRTGLDLHTGEEVWSYGRGHRAMSGGNVNGWMQFRNYWEAWFGLAFNPEGTQRWDTRDNVTLENGDEEDIPGGGPLISEPTTWGGWWGFGTDSRKSLVGSVEGNYYDDAAGNASVYLATGLRWNQSSTMHHDLDVGYRQRIDDTQHLDNFENPGGGIGGVSYVYGRLYQKIFDLTIRSSLLFDRNKSLEAYAQPYLTVGDYREARELVTPDSYDLRPYADPEFDHDDFDFSYAAVNLNLVYRWEYRPGSTFYLVWAHSRSAYDERSDHVDRSAFENGLRPGTWFDNEPENVFLVKLSYWLPI